MTKIAQASNGRLGNVADATQKNAYNCFFWLLFSKNGENIRIINHIIR